MIEVKVCDKIYNIRSSWMDVTYKQYCEILLAQDLSWSKRLHIYTGIEEKILARMKLNGLTYLLDAVSFMDDPDTVNEFAFPYESDLKIGHETYGKLEQAKQALTNAAHPMLAAGEVVNIYTGEDIAEKKVTDVMGCIAFFLSALESSWTNTSGLLNTKPPLKKWRQALSDLKHLAHGQP